MVGIGNRPDPAARAPRADVMTLVRDRPTATVYTEDVARAFGIEWSEAQAVLSELRRAGLLKYEVVERPYSDRSKRGRTYTTFCWRSRAG